MDDHDEDFFSDDGFDDLPPGTLLQLEEAAYRSTPAVQQNPQPPPTRPEEPPQYDASESIGQSGPANSNLKPPPLHTGLTNEYGGLDVGELDAEVLHDDTGSTNALDQAMAFAGQQAPLQHHVQEQMQQDYTPVAEENHMLYHAPADDTMGDIEGEELFHRDMHEAHNALAEKVTDIQSLLHELNERN